MDPSLPSGGSGKEARGEGGDRGRRKSRSLIGALRSLGGGGGVIGLTLRQVCFSLTHTHTHAHPASFRSPVKNDEVRRRVATAAADGSHTTESQFASFTGARMREVYMQKLSVYYKILPYIIDLVHSCTCLR